jgi:hypothetical protein
MIDRLLPVRLHLTLAISQGEPSSHLLAKRSRASRCWSPGRLSGLVLGCLVLLEQALKFFVLVATLARQILLRVLKFVLIEFQLRFCQCELAGSRTIGVGLFGQLGDAVLIYRNLCFPPGRSVRELFERTSGRNAGRGSFAERGSKRQIELMIGKPQRIPRERLFLGCIGESVQLLRALKQTAVYGRRRGRARLPCRGLVRTYVTGDIRPHEAGN